MCALNVGLPRRRSIRPAPDLASTRHPGSPSVGVETVSQPPTQEASRSLSRSFPTKDIKPTSKGGQFFFCFVLFYKSLMKAAECSESSVGETPILQMRKQGHMASKHRVGVEPPSLLARSVHSPQDTSWTSHMGVAGGRIGRWVTSEVLVEGASWLAPWVVPS